MAFIPATPTPRSMRYLTLTFLVIAGVVSTAIAQENNSPPAPPATAPVITGFGDGSQFSINAVNSPTAITNSVLNLTTATSSVAASAFYNTRVNIQQFTASFTFTYFNSNWPGDGFTFTVQNDQYGPTALGYAGGDLGYTGIYRSAGLGFNLYPGYMRGTFSLQDGYVPINSYNQFSPAYFTSGIPYTVTLTYANSLMLATITGSDLTNPYQSSYTFDLPYLLGDSLAYVGFTGATGAAVMDLTITDFTFATPVPEPTTWALMGSGLGFLGWAHRRRSRRVTPQAKP
jgi:hypothetical protein